MRRISALTGSASLRGRELLAHVHRQLAAQVRIARMHLRRHRAGHAARGVVARPVAGAVGLVGEPFDDREAVPDHGLVVPQDRHLAARGRELVALGALVPGLVEHRHGDLLERQARLLDRQPAAQRPGGIGLVADDELEHPRSSYLVMPAEAGIQAGLRPSDHRLDPSLRWGDEGGWIKPSAASSTAARSRSMPRPVLARRDDDLGMGGGVPARLRLGGARRPRRARSP